MYTNGFFKSIEYGALIKTEHLLKNTSPLNDVNFKGNFSIFEGHSQPLMNQIWIWFRLLRYIGGCGLRVGG